MDYGWSFFQICIDELNESELQNTKLLAFAHRVSMSDNFEEYMKIGEDEGVDKKENTNKSDLTYEEAIKLMRRKL